MTRAARSFLALLALALIGAAQQPAAAPVGVEGVYSIQRMETASALQLTPDGRFAWFLSYGALDMAGEGRWSRSADGSLLLNSEPAYVAPRFEPTGASRDAEPGVLVRVVDESGEAPTYLEAVVEYDNGERDHGYFQEGTHRFTAEPGRTIVAVYLGSRAFDILSERYPVTAEANVLSFRFFPNHVGRADFRDLPVSVEPDALTFTWRGTEMRYVRQSETELAAEEPPELTDSELGIDRWEAMADTAGDASDAPDQPALLGPPEPVSRASATGPCRIRAAG